MPSCYLKLVAPWQCSLAVLCMSPVLAHRITSWVSCSVSVLCVTPVMRCSKRGWLVAALIAVYYCWLQTMGPGTVSLGTANSYTILSKAGISTTVLLPTSITGDVGVSPIAATAITGCSLTVQPLLGSALHESCAGSLHHHLVQQLLGSALHESCAGSSHHRLVQQFLGSALHESCAGSLHHHLVQLLCRSALHESCAGSSHDRLVQQVLGSGLRESCAGSSHHHLGQQLRRSTQHGSCAGSSHTVWSSSSWAGLCVSPVLAPLISICFCRSLAAH